MTAVIGIQMWTLIMVDERILRATKNFEFERKNWRFNGGDCAKSHKQSGRKKVRSRSRKAKVS